MKKKLDLSLDRLAVDSFETDRATPDRGTVEAQGAECTAPATCRCPTSLIRCGTLPATAFSCPRTFDCL